MPLTKRTHKRFLDCSKMTIEEATQYGTVLAEIQRDVLFQLGDLARYAEARWPDTHHQVWPEWVSPGTISRTAAVARAYPKEEDRQHECTYSQYMQCANRSDRHERLDAIEEAGLTTDESRREQSADTPRPRWLLAVDVHYHLHRHWFSGAGVEAAVQVADWVQRTVDRLKEKNLSDVVCCFDSKVNNRKELTADWEDKYKDRPPKDPELGQQLNLVRELLDGRGYCCALVDGYEADDVMASFAAQFPGKVTLLSADKDVRQCLGEHCNILRDVEWVEDESSGELTPDYKWVSGKSHFEETGIPPHLWTEYQCIMGDTVDGVKGAIGIGKKGAADLVRLFGDCERIIQAARCGDQRIKPKKREALLAFDEKLEVTRQLVTLKADLELPTNTRI